MLFWCAAGLMASGVWLQVCERHEHPHTHKLFERTHRHRHDEHRQHEHDFEWDGTEPQTHPHIRVPITHALMFRTSITATRIDLALPRAKLNHVHVISARVMSCDEEHAGSG